MRKFVAHDYFEQINRSLKLTIEHKFRFCRVTGLSQMEEVLQTFSKDVAYMAVDDTADPVIFQNSGGGYYERKMVTVYLLKKVAVNNMDQQAAALEVCRTIFYSICKKLIKDKSQLQNDMIYLRTDRISSYEMGGYVLSGCTGLYFMFTVDIPIQLTYDKNEWTDE